MDLELDFITKLVNLMSDNGINEIELKDGDREIHLSRNKDHTVQTVSVPTVMPGMVSQMTMPVNSAGQIINNQAEATVEEIDPDIEVIVSPMVGTFYRAPRPDADPFVETGESVTDDTTVAIIEAMKVMNEIKAEMTGEIVEILVANGESVEWGQPLFHIRRQS